LRISNPPRSGPVPDLARARGEAHNRGMKPLLLLAIGALAAGAAAQAPPVPLQALTEADVGPDALSNAACYVHDGPAVLLVATRKNAVVNHDGDLLLLRRAGDRAFPSGGARYTANNFEVVIAAAAEEPGEAAGDGRSDRAAQVSVRASGRRQSMTARWSCGAPA
jgi:hypothetical protein